MKVLVPLDGSEGSECVLAYIRSLGQRQDVQVYLLRAQDTVPQESAAQYLDAVESRLEVRQLSSWSLTGSAPEEICRVALQQECDLIVMAHNLHSDPSRLGSVAESVLQTAPCPVLLIRPPAPESSRFRHILIPVDGSPASLKVHLQLAPYAGRNTQVTLLTATDLPEPSDLERLTDNLKKVRVGGVEFRVQVVRGEAAGSILNWAAEEGCDLIFMASHAYCEVPSSFLGSVTQRILREATCSVLIFPAAQ